MVNEEGPFVGWDVWPLPDGVTTMQKAGKFYLWEARFVSEATLVNGPASATAA
jgi:hypothetical protein